MSEHHSIESNSRVLSVTHDENLCYLCSLRLAVENALKTPNLEHKAQIQLRLMKEMIDWAEELKETNSPQYITTLEKIASLMSDFRY